MTNLRPRPIRTLAVDADEVAAVRELLVDVLGDGTVLGSGPRTALDELLDAVSTGGTPVDLTVDGTDIVLAAGRYRCLPERSRLVITSLVPVRLDQHEARIGIGDPTGGEEQRAG